jgi:ankyrin repeat protein
MSIGHPYALSHLARLRFFAASGLAFLALAAGCGTSKTPSSSISGTATNARAEDMPVCGAVMQAPSPAAALRLYHLSPGATDSERLFLAVFKDDVQSLTTFLDSGADVNSVHGRSFTVAQDGLISFADDSSNAHNERVSLLHWAAAMSFSGDTIRLLITRGANVQTKDSSGVTPLMEAAGNSNLSASSLSALLAAGANVHDRDGALKDPLLHVFLTKNTDHRALCAAASRAQALIAAGADIRENLTYTPTMTALTQRNLGMAKLAYSLGDDLRARAALDGGTALHVVARAGDDSLETVRWLVLRGVDLLARDNQHKTALDLFKENLTDGHCHAMDPAQPKTNLCAVGTAAIIKAIERRHRR